MFTGIVEAVGRIHSVESRGGDLRVSIDAGRLDLSDLKVGDSVAVGGVCLTVVERGGKILSFDVSRESLACTTLAQIRAGTRVNLERALLPTTRLGGHFVSGHVDAVGTIEAHAPAGGCVCLTVAAPAALFKYIAAKGSICVDGVSLTVNAVNPPTFEVNVIPHTLDGTTLGQLRAGAAVNLEVDILARYLERLRSGDDGAKEDRKISETFLRAHGFID